LRTSSVRRIAPDSASDERRGRLREAEDRPTLPENLLYAGHAVSVHPHQQEIRQQERVRTERRELQILEAKRADALKGIDLLKKRHELGALSKLQYDNMVAKRQAELAKIEAEIAAMEREG